MEDIREFESEDMGSAEIQDANNTVLTDATGDNRGIENIKEDVDFQNAAESADEISFSVDEIDEDTGSLRDFEKNSDQVMGNDIREADIQDIEDIPEDVEAQNYADVADEDMDVLDDVIEDNEINNASLEADVVMKNEEDATNTAMANEINDGESMMRDSGTQADTVEEKSQEARENIQEPNSEHDIQDSPGEYPTVKDFEGKDYLSDVKQHYDRAEDVAGDSYLKHFKAHDLEGHIDKVIERSAEAADVIENTNPDVKLDAKDLGIAALYHDTGMDGGDQFDSTDGDGIRKNHPMTSALNILENREKIEADGANADQVAALALLHSKSSSGVEDLSDSDAIRDAFSRLQSEVEAYNLRNPDAKLTFSDQSMMENMDAFKHNAAALRIGDAFGHDSSSTKSQSGGHYDIDFNADAPLVHKEWSANAWQDEVKGTSVTFYEKGKTTGDIIDDATDIQMNKETGKNEMGKIRMFQFGEGNIESMHSQMGKDGNFEAVFDIKNAMAKPLCTQQCIQERLDELNGAYNLFPSNATINLHGDYTDDIKHLYESFKRQSNYHGTININCLGGKRIANA